MKMYVLAVLMLAAFNASATNNGSGCQGNCPSTGGGTTNNEANSHANGGNGYGGSGGDGTGVGIGVGVGLGGNAEGGAGGRGGEGGDGGSGMGVAVVSGVSGGDASAGVIGSGNSSAQGGDSKAYGGNASQGQQMGQGQSLKNDSTTVSGSKSIAQQALENSTRVDASSRNANQSSASGNTTATTVNVGGDSTLVERNAPPVFLGAITPTSCGGSFNAGGSNRDGAGALGWSWVGRECEKRMVADRFQQYGQVDVACRIMKTSKAFKAAVKDDPSLASIDCAMKPAPAAVVVPVAPELAPRIPRG